MVRYKLTLSLDDVDEVKLGETSLLHIPISLFVCGLFGRQYK